MMASRAASHAPVGTRARPAGGAEFNAAAHGLRGIASMMVFWAHLLGGAAEHVYPHQSEYSHVISGPWNFGVWGVELFFVISGYVILPSIRRYDLGDFALRRFFRLYPLFFACTLFFVILNGLTNLYPDMNTGTAIVSGFLFLNIFTGTEQLTPNAWSLTYEVIFYALASLAFHFAYRRPSRVKLFIIGLCSALFLIRYPIAIFFLGGVLIRLADDAEIRLPASLVRPLEAVLALTCIWLAASRHFNFSQADLVDYRTWALMAATPAYFFLAVQPGSLSSRLFGNAEIGYLGTISYSLYLVHPYTYFAAREVLERAGLFTHHWAIAMPLFFLITTPITLAATHVVHTLLEIRPYRWFFHERIYKVKS